MRCRFEQRLRRRRSRWRGCFLACGRMPRYGSERCRRFARRSTTCRCSWRQNRIVGPISTRGWTTWSGRSRRDDRLWANSATIHLGLTGASVFTARIHRQARCFRQANDRATTPSRSFTASGAEHGPDQTQDQINSRLSDLRWCHHDERLFSEGGQTFHPARLGGRFQCISGRAKWSLI